MSWLELDEAAKTGKIFLIGHDEVVQVDLNNGDLTIEHGGLTYSVRLAPGSKLRGVVSVSKSSTLTLVTLAFEELNVFGFSEHWPDHELRAALCCRSCNHPVVHAGKRGFWIPAMSSEMHACEECQQLDSKLASKHIRKSQSERIFISDLSLLVEGVSESCPECKKQLGRVLSSHSSILSELHAEGCWTEIDKKNLVSEELTFLSAYDDLSEAGRLLERTVEERGVAATRRLCLANDSGDLTVEIKILSHVLCVHKLGAENSKFRALKCLVNSGSAPSLPDQVVWTSSENIKAIKNAAETDSLPAELFPSKTWKLVLIPLPPEIDE